MPRYYFHVYDGISSVDAEGTELADIAAARRDAVKLMGRIMLDDAQAAWNADDWRLDVTDEHGLTLFSLLFAVTDCTPASAARMPGTHVRRSSRDHESGAERAN
jgi:hypothetical protein